MEYPLNIDSESLLVCDMNKLEDHLVHKLGYTETDVCNLIELLTAHPNRINLSLMIDIKVYIKSHIGYVGKDLTRYQLYFLTLNKLIGRFDILRIALQCLSNINRVRFLHTKHHGSLYKASLLHLIAQYPLTAKTTKTILESIDESQHYQLLSSQAEYKYTPIHYACLYKNRQLLHIIIEHISKESWNDLLQTTSMGRYTPLHHTAWWGSEEAIKTIAFSSYPPVENKKQGWIFSTTTG